MINSPAFKEEARYTLSVEVMSGSYLDGKIVDELRLPERCIIINVHRTGKLASQRAETDAGGSGADRNGLAGYRETL